MNRNFQIYDNDSSQRPIATRAYVYIYIIGRWSLLLASKIYECISVNESHSIHGENVSLALGGEGGTKGW